MVTVFNVNVLVPSSEFPDIVGFAGVLGKAPLVTVTVVLNIILLISTSPEVFIILQLPNVGVGEGVTGGVDPGVTDGVGEFEGVTVGVGEFEGVGV